MAMNPFKPTAGKMPPILIGRETAIEEFTEGLDNGAGAQDASCWSPGSAASARPCS